MNTFLPLLFIQNVLLAASFAPTNTNNIHIPATSLIVKPTSKTTTAIHDQRNDNIIDAEFYSNEDELENDDSNRPSSTVGNAATATATGARKTSPLQASLASVDPKLSSLSINFIDPAPKSSLKQSFIPCRMAFIVHYDNVEYTIGTPIDSQVAIYVEDTKSNTANFIDPDEDDNMEIMERAASVFESKYKHISLSDDDEDILVDDKDENEKQRLNIRFKRTPRTLTVEGDLSMITGNWRQDSKKQVDSIKDVAKGVLNEIEKESDSTSDDEYFDSFFAEQLGSNYKQDALENSALDEQAEELMEMFNIPGLGTEQGDNDGIKDMLGDIFNGNDEKLSKDKSTDQSNAESETALRLVGFSDESDDGKVYSLVQLIQPMILVAKNDPSLEMDERMLLTVEEADVIVPLLEKQFEEEFKDAGISLKP